MRNKKFIDAYMEGKISAEDIQKYVDSFKIEENNDELHDFLGLTKEEYELWQKQGTVAIENVLSAKKFKIEIIRKAKTFFRDEIAKSHKQNTYKLKSLDQFTLNPFLDKYKANFLTGDDSPRSIAKALVYPRVLGTSINTTFGTKLQKFCSEILQGFASTTSGIDIEFIDMLDGKRKYCQIKAGPNTINKDDVDTIDKHFQAIKNLARTNNLNIGFNDLIVGVFYGEVHELSTHYKNIAKTYPVYAGKEFWHRLTGDEDFYAQLTDVIGDVAMEYDARDMLEEVIEALAKEIQEKF